MLQGLIELLKQTAHTVRVWEASAVDALHNHGDEARYRELMRHKVELLLELPDEAAPRMDGIDPTLKNVTSAKLESISFRAEQALGLESVFYQAQLLYPEDYGEGDPNELERFITELETRATP